MKDDEDEPGPSSRGSSKRGRPPGGGSRRKRGHGDGDDDDEVPSSKKRRGGAGRSLNFDKMGGNGGSRLQRKMRKVLDIVMKHTDAEGRILSQPFMKLPTRKELPDYYEVIKRPIDINKILVRLQQDKYPVSQRFRVEYGSIV